MAKYDVYYGEPEDRDARIGGIYEPEQGDDWAEYAIELTDEEFVEYRKALTAWNAWQRIIHSKMECV